jgi:hypothetical protein
MSTGTLPAKALAHWIGVLAIAGSALSLSVHTFAALGLYSKAILGFEIYLFVVLFPILIIAGLAYNRLLAELSSTERMRIYNPIFSLKMARKLSANAPAWLRIASLSLFLYAAVRSLLSGFLFSSESVVADAKGLCVFSAYVAAFLALAATILISYAGTENSLTADEL